MDGDDERLSQFEVHAGDTDWRDRGDALYEEMLDSMIEDFPAYDLANDPEFAELLWEGWFDSSTSELERVVLWVSMEYDYPEIWENFDWESWREWYDS